MSSKQTKISYKQSVLFIGHPVAVQQQFDSYFQGLYEAMGTPLVIILGLPLVLCVAVGYKTKLVSVILICALLLHNINQNQFWTSDLTQNEYDYKKNEFFIVLSIIGGVIHLLVYGAGGISVDQRLKSE